MNSIREFTFIDLLSADKLTVKILESPVADYGFYIWPSAPVLALHVWQNKHVIKDSSVLEIGAGTGLPGIVAAKCGATVILSDNTSCLELCQKSLEINNLTNVRVLGITWGEISSSLRQLPKIDVVLASDCFYNTKDFEDVIMTLSFILHCNPGAEVWCTYQVRSSERSIEYLLDKWLLFGKEVCLPNMDLLKSTYEGHLKHTIKLYIIKLKSCI